MTDLPEFRLTPVEEFAAVDEPGAAPLASSDDGGVVIPAGGDVLVFGDGGAGKTTLVIDWSIALARGVSWLGLVESERPLRICVVENEGPRPMLRLKLRRKLATTGVELDGRLVVLEEPWASLTLADDQHRRRLAAALAAHETDLLVLGPLVSVGEFPTGGTPTEVARFEQHTHELRSLLDRPLAILLVHHENKAGGVSGGWGRYGDTHLHVTAQGNGRTRIRWAKARWASSLHKTSTQLLWADGETFTIEDKPEITEDTMRQSLLDAVRDHPGLSWSKLKELKNDGVPLVRGNATELKHLRDALIADRLLVNTAIRDGQFTLYPADDPTATRSDARTTSERVTFPPAASEENPTRSAVPAIEGTAPGTERVPEPQTDQNDPHEIERLADLARTYQAADE
jgi:hypothetical protein